ncbi:hypothetical protein V8E53_013333 [Lactarius tabidus]
MSDHVPNPTHAHFANTFSGIADNLDRAPLFSGLRRKSTSGQIQRGDTYMDRSRFLLEQYGPMLGEDEKIIRATYNDVRGQRIKLKAKDVSGFQKFRKAREFKRLSKETYEIIKVTSDRARDDGLAAGVSPAIPEEPTTPEESSGTDPPGRTGLVVLYINSRNILAGPPPVTPKEPARPPPHNLFTVSHGATTSSRGERIQDTQMTTLSSGDADTRRPMVETHGTSTSIYDLSKATSEITLASYKTAMDEILDTTMTTLSSGDAGMGGPIDEAPETTSFTYDESLATSGTSITSYKTENISVVSNKSRYNVLPRHKYAGHGYSRPQGPGSLGVDNASVPRTKLGDGYDQSGTSPPSGTRPLDGPSTASPNTEAQDVPEETRSQTPTPRQGVEFLSVNPSWRTGGERECKSFNFEVSNRN